MNLQNSIKIAKQYLGEEYFSGLNIILEKNNCFATTRVSKNDTNVRIQYNQLSHLFRALTLIKEKCHEQSFEYELFSSFNTCGVMLDCSRNGVLNNEKVKEFILICALMGHNRLFLYTEDTFSLEKYPYFGYLRGAYSKEDIKEFVNYGESFGVELIPCIQTLGHLRQALKWAPMDSLKDGPDTLLVGSPATYTFIEEMIKFCRECFSTKEIHVGMDESLEMGLKKYLKINGYKDRVLLLKEHIANVKNICNKYGFSPMIWSDMLFRLNNEKDNYYSDHSLPKKTADIVPEGVKLVYWDYYHKDKEDYEKMIDFHKEISNEIVFAGGSWRWKGFTPSIKKSIEYTKSALDACLKANIKDVFITGWGDDGNECSFFSVIPVLAELSIMNFGSYDFNGIDSLIKAITGDNLVDFFALDLPDLIQDKEMEPSYNPSKYLLYQDVLLGMFDSQVKPDFAKKYISYADILFKEAEKSQRYGYIYKNLANLCRVLSIKSDIGIKLREAYKANNLEELSQLVVALEDLIARLDDFRDSNEKQWMIECRPFGYEVLDGRIGFLRARIITARNRVNDYLNGKIKKIEELEIKILPFDGRNDELSWNWWLRNVSPSN